MALREFQDQDQSLALRQSHHNLQSMPSGGKKTKLNKVVLGDRLQDKVNKGIVEAA
jgi:hypothetical protein